MKNQLKSQNENNSIVTEFIEKSPLPTNPALKTVEMAKKNVIQIKNNQIIAGIVGTSGFVVFALGVESFISTIPALSSPFVEVAIGLIMLSVSGLLLKKLN